MRHLEDHVVALILLLHYFSPPHLTQLQLQDKSGIVDRYVDTKKSVLTMKVLVVLLGLITATFLSGKGTREEERSTVAGTRVIVGYHPQLTGVADVIVTINAYNATRELDIPREPLTLGTRVVLTCDVTGHPKDRESLSYRWYHNCTELPNSACELHNPVPYYRVVKDTLLVDVTSWSQGGAYYCSVPYLQREWYGTTRGLSVAG